MAGHQPSEGISREWLGTYYGLHWTYISMNAAKWPACAGMDSVRKVLVDQEISANCTEKR